MSKAGKQRVPDYLGHILEAIRRIHLYIEDMTEVQFLEDAKTQDAVIRNFEIIGEACRNIDSHHPSSHRNILRCHGGLPTKCAMRWLMAISRWILKLSGRLFTTTCQTWPIKLTRCWASHMKLDAMTPFFSLCLRG
jgi:hypothetical protein